MKTLLLATGAIAVSLCMGSAKAGPFDDPLPTFEVRYTDLDLTKVSDQLRLKHRLARAASVLCKEVDNAMPVAPVDPVCYRLTLQTAVQQVDRAVARANSGAVLALTTAASQHR